MPPVVFVGLGLDSERGISLEGLEEIRRADRVFAEFYTSLMCHLSLEHLEAIAGKKIRVLERTEMEDENAADILSLSGSERVVLLVPGDPMIATTHVSLRLSLAKRNVQSRIVHGASIVSAICGATGLQSFKFGKSITLPSEGLVPASVFDTIQGNVGRGLHTLLLLDVLNGGTLGLTVQDSLARMCEETPQVESWLTIGVARVGSPDEKVKAARAKTLRKIDFGSPPHCIVFPGKLHFMEEEALRVFAEASAEDLEDNR